ncbi:MAG: DUF1353 domain-containing protein [Dehalococcoidia bacterium]|jgi:hypothetical protein
MSSFTTRLIVSPLPDGKTWQLMEEFDYHIGAEDNPECIHVPKDFLTDFASTHWLQYAAIFLTVLYGSLAFLVDIPAWAGIIFLAVILAAILITPYGKPGKAAVLHDWLYNCKVFSRKKSDQVFLEAMCVLKVAPWKRNLMYWGVRLFGFLAWKGKSGG